jgi:hypothetical protein
MTVHEVWFDQDVVAIVAPSLALDVLAGNEASAVVLDSSSFELVRRKIVALIVSVEGGNAYHHMGHYFAVEERAERLSKEAYLSTRETFLLRIAALCHDLAHCGSTYRQIRSLADYPELSNEEYAALLADEVLQGVVCIEDRIAIQDLILATSFGQLDSSGLPLAKLWRPYAAKTHLERLLVFADVNGLEHSLTRFIEDFLDVALEGSYLDKAMQAEFASAAMVGFLGHVSEVLNSVAELFPTIVASRYQALLATRRFQAEQIAVSGTFEAELFLWLANKRMH